MDSIDNWFEKNGLKALPFQKRTWKAYLKGKSGLIQSSTGSGKSYAIWLACLKKWINENPSFHSSDVAPPLKILWITPLKALANDLLNAISKPVKEIGLPWTLQIRTGDVSSAVRRRQNEKLPTALIITPESLSLFLSYEHIQNQMRRVECVIVDEWHELLGTKRGVQTELVLARMKNLNPGLRIWGLSATLGNTHEALDVLTGRGQGREKTIINGPDRKDIHIELLVPEEIERFPWAGHIGTKMLHRVIEQIEEAQSTLVFTNVRSAAEIWFNRILDMKPEWAGEIALHHGSIESRERIWVEEQIRCGKMKCVVCTSSLDLGVDFSPVDQVIQIGSPKSVSRILQRAGRSGHNPEGSSRIVCVPTHAFEVVEFVAVKNSLNRKSIETRKPLKKSLDVLCQHLVTVALGGGFIPEDMFNEIRSTFCFSDLSQEEWKWTLNFLDGRGEMMKNYPQYSRIENRDGTYFVSGYLTKRFHRLSIGTITGNETVMVRYLNGKKIGSVEEGFIARLKKGDRFLFAGKFLELVSFRDMSAYVRQAGNSGIIPRWSGGRMPISRLLGEEIKSELERFQKGKHGDPDMDKVKPVLELQSRSSCIPARDELLIEQVKTRNGFHNFIYPFEGLLAHEGLGMLMSYRISRILQCTISVSANEYGFDLLSSIPLDLGLGEWMELFSKNRLFEDLTSTINVTEMSKRQFRDIARISCLLYSGYPGKNRTARQFQVSSSALFEMFSNEEKRNLLVEQAKREVLESLLEFRRLSESLERVASQSVTFRKLDRLSPLSFPLWAQEIKTQISTEKWEDRVKRMVLKLEKEQV